MHLNDTIREDLERPTLRNSALTPMLALLLCLPCYSFIDRGYTYPENSAGREIRTVVFLPVNAFKLLSVKWDTEYWKAYAGEQVRNVALLQTFWDLYYV